MTGAYAVGHPRPHRVAAMRLRRVPAQDELTVDGETVVLVDGHASLLSRPASYAVGLLAADAWLDAGEWFSRVTDAFGVPPEADALEHLVAGLVDAGVVVTDADL